MKGLIQDRSFELAELIVHLSRKLIQKRESLLSRQVVRSGTAVGAWVQEAQDAESGKDFIHKLSIALKECRETIYWLRLIERSGYVAGLSIQKEKDLANFCCAILTKIVKSKKQKMSPS